MTGVKTVIENETNSVITLELEPTMSELTTQIAATTGTIDTLKSAYIIGQENFDNWSQGFDPNGYLKVLPNPDIVVPYRSPFQQWQIDNANYKDGVFKYQADDGSYYSSWGPKDYLEVTLTMDELEKIAIDGFGILETGDHFIDWLNKATPYDFLRAYNSIINGPMLISEPGDTLKITLVNNLDDVSNFHTHGLHVSPVGNGDNVLITINPGEVWQIDITIPDDHFIGTQWYHPHFHGLTNDQVASGLSGFLIINPPYDLPDLDKFNLVTEPSYFMAINSFGIQQQNRPSSPTDPLNQSPDPTFVLPAGTPLQIALENGQPVYSLSEAPFVGYNAKPLAYNPQAPQGNPPGPNFSSAYGEGGLAEPVENVIHTINGQYNPTIATETGQWELFSFANMTVNAFHVIQLVKVNENGNLTPQSVELVAIDGDAAGVVEGTRRAVTDSPVLSPGSRVSLQYWFEEPGVYYFLSNATDEILGDDAPILTKDKGFQDGHLIWGSQVLATVKVTGESIPAGPFPEAYDYLQQQSEEINQLVDSALAGDVTREREFTWSANIGGALLEGNIPDDTEVKTFEGTYKINGQYFATQGLGMPPLTMPMLGTNEIWTLRNISGINDAFLSQLGINIPLLEWHPFHIHQNDFIVLEINGLPVEDIDQNYLARVLADTVALPPSYAPGSVTPQNPYGTPQLNGIPSEVKILMEFEDYPGAYVNHCHILFHEDAGMMGVVRVILNTNDTWLGTSQASGGSVSLFLASDQRQFAELIPYGTAFQAGVQIAIADVNTKLGNQPGNTNVTDNVTDVITIQRSLGNLGETFVIKVFDGASLIQKQKSGSQFSFSGSDEDLLLAEIVPFQGLSLVPGQTSAIAAGDIDGDGYADIVVGVGGVAPAGRIEIYSGKDFSLMAKFNPFHHETFSGSLNLAVGDANGDNFDDILVSQGEGGRGLVEIYSGIEFYKLIQSGEIQGLSLNGLAHSTTLLMEEFQPYGPNYTGEVKVTSGYGLPRPDSPPDELVYDPSQVTTVYQTSHANVTTLATGELPSNLESVQIWTYLGGHGSHGDHGSHSGHGEPTGPELRLDKTFTPNSNIANFSGTFADIPGGDRGEPVLFVQTNSLDYELLYLTSQEGTLTTIPVVDPLESSLAFGTPGADTAIANDPSSNVKIDGIRDIIFTGAGPDEIDTAFATTAAYAGDNRIDAGSDRDIVYVNNNDRAFGGSGDDLLDATDATGYRLSGGDGNDELFLGADGRAIGGEGNDKFWVQEGGGNLLTGGTGVDQFWITTGDLPTTANTIVDFQPGIDVIGIGGQGTGFGFEDLTRSGNNILIGSKTIATLIGVNTASLSPNNFVFVSGSPI
jgi:FtsP/CotA-like multicopper oxidase with cupredoxin domain